MSKPVQSILYCVALLVTAELVLRLPLGAAGPDDVQDPASVDAGGGDARSGDASPGDVSPGDVSPGDVSPGDVSSGASPPGDFTAPSLPVYFALGSSRTKRAVDPLRIERALAADGVPDAWVGNASYLGVTMPFLHRLYQDEIRPIVRRGSMAGILAIEVRGSALNDSYMTPAEEKFVAQGRFDPIEPLPGAADPSAGGSGSTEIPATGAGDSRMDGDVASRLAVADFEGAAKRLMWSLRIAQGRDETIRWIERIRRPSDSAEPGFASPESVGSSGVGDPGGVGSDPESGSAANATDPARRAAAMRQARSRIEASGMKWTKNRRGFDPLEANKIRGSLQVGKWRRRYQDELLADFELGGVQTDFLRRLIRDAKADGLLPVLYLMPITEIHRGFYASGDYDRMIAFIERVAAAERVPFVDLDHALGYDETAFQDTHHLDPSALDAFSVEFARRVLLARGKP